MEIATKAACLILFFSKVDDHSWVREVSIENINVEIPWQYFDGVAKGDPVRCGGGIVLHLDERNNVHCKVGLGSGTNNFAKINALRLLLITTLEWGVPSLQLFGDSKIVIDWVVGSTRCNIIQIKKNHFYYISLIHVYRERNTTANGLSKEGAQL